MNRNPFVTPIKSFTSDMRINPLKEAIRPIHLCFQDGFVRVPAGGSNTQTMIASQDTMVEMWKVSGVVPNNANPFFTVANPVMDVLIKSSHIGWNLMNRPILWNNIIGTGDRPHPMFTSLFLSPNQKLEWKFFNRDVFAMDAWLDLHGRAFYYQKYGNGAEADEFQRITTSLAAKRMFPFWLTTDLVPTLTSLTDFVPFMMTVPYKVHFEVKYVMSRSAQPFEWTLFDSSSGQFLHNNIGGGPLDSRVTTGTAQLPYELEEPLLIGPNARVTLMLRSLVAVPNRVDFCLAGRLIQTQEQA